MKCLTLITRSNSWGRETGHSHGNHGKGDWHVREVDADGVGLQIDCCFVTSKIIE